VEGKELLMQGSGRHFARLTIVAVLALAMGLVAATALARHGDDDGPEGTTGTTATTQTTPTAPAGVGERVRIKGRVVERDPGADAFVVKVAGGERVQIVDAPRVPRIGRLVVVRGVQLDDGTVDANRVRVTHRHRHHDDGDRRADDDHRACEPGDDCGGLRDDDDDEDHDDEDRGGDNSGPGSDSSGPGGGGGHSGRG
jgi:hypothetical protein